MPNASPRSRPPFIATPGRLNDLLVNHGVDRLCSGLQVLIFDEADQLLEMGFRPDVLKILAALQPSASTRQTLLFSATLPKDVLSVAEFATRDATLVDTVGDDAEQTNAHVQQWATRAPLESQAAELLVLLRSLTAHKPFKIVVFFVTARLTQLYSEAFARLDGLPKVLEMHSRRSQSARTKVADEFREGDNLILFSSDVSARGMDYPDVTAVIQVGMPSDKAQYVHRLGRTGRAGKAGGGYLLLTPEEEPFLKMVSDLPIARREPAVLTSAASGRSHGHRNPAGPHKRSGSHQIGGVSGWLGFYNTYTKRLGWSWRRWCRANTFASVLGLSTHRRSRRAQSPRWVSAEFRG